MNENNQKCNRCKKTLKIEEFTEKNKIFKTCNICRKSQNEKRRKNICEICGINAIFNFEKEKNGIRCKKHIQVGMVDIKHPKCIKCKKKNPNFNYEGEDNALYCKDCSEIDMIDIKHPKCLKCKKKQPTFNYKGEDNALYCKGCSEHDMVDIKKSKCVKCKKKQPVFNYESEDNALYCKDCCELDMVNIKSFKCIKCKKKQPTFNYENETKALYCKDCSEPGMVDIKHPKCIKCKKKNPNFNYECEDKALYCKDCAEIGMVDIKNSKCIKCKKKQPNFNYYCETKVLYCKDCAKPDMVDIKNLKCHCGTRATFGYINQGKTHCSRHKLLLMFKQTKPLCQCENCKEIAEYGKEEPIHCFEHRLNEELCLLGKTCINCKRENELCNKDGLCLTYCRPVEIDLNIKKIIKKKEALVLSYLDKNVKFDINPIDDKIIDTSCVKNRPDRVYDCRSHFVVVEIDENQHKYYTNGCSYDKKVQEMRRMVQIHEALSKGMIPVIFLRFNPDNFKIKGKLQKINIQKRLEILEKWLKKCVTIDIFSFNKCILIKHLFYDEYDETNTKFETIEDVSELL